MSYTNPPVTAYMQRREGIEKYVDDPFFTDVYCAQGVAVADTLDQDGLLRITGINPHFHQQIDLEDLGQVLVVYLLPEQIRQLHAQLSAIVAEL